MYRFLTQTLCAAVTAMALPDVVLVAQEPRPVNKLQVDQALLADPPELNEQEQAFVDQMKNSKLVGSFVSDGRGDSAKSDKYEIQAVQKIKDNDWMVHARIVYGEIDVVVPVPVQMHWAEDTPILSVTDLSIPLVGEGFSTRLLFYEGRYAGTWSHGKVGGHMWGKVEHAEPAAEDAPTEGAAPAAKDEKPPAR